MRVAVFGLGYVGAVTAACLADRGHQVWGVDVDAGKVATLSAGRSPVAEPGLGDLVAAVVASGRLRATTRAAEALAGADVSLLCVGTPSTPSGKTDLSHVRKVVEDIAAALTTVQPPPSRRHAVVMRSTVPPGTVEWCGDMLRELLGPCPLEVGVAMCPEFLREGSGIADFFAPPFTIVGSDSPVVIETLRSLFYYLDAPVKGVSTRTAEALKYACNAFHATKVSFANELGRVFRGFGIDSREVMTLFCEDEQLNISPRYLRPGFAFGGSCLPKDLRSLLHMGRMDSVDLPLLSGVLSTNVATVNDVVERVTRGPGNCVTLVGLSFKTDSDDLRESPYVSVAEMLVGKGYELRIYDPIVRPSDLVGANRAYVQSTLPHLQCLLTGNLHDALASADTAIVSYFSPEVVGALLEVRPPRVIDLDGRLGALVESLPGYEGMSW